MPKTNAEKCREYRRKRRENKIKKVAKSSTERVREFRARQKGLLNVQHNSIAHNKASPDQSSENDHSLEDFKSVTVLLSLNMSNSGVQSAKKEQNIEDEGSTGCGKMSNACEGHFLYETQSTDSNQRVDNKAAERSRLYRKRHREKINQRRRDIRHHQQHLQQMHAISNVQDTDDIGQISHETSDSQLGTSLHTQRQRRYYERHKEEINKRRRDRRLNQNNPKSMPASAADRGRKYRERNRQEVNKRRRERRRRQQTLLRRSSQENNTQHFGDTQHDRVQTEIATLQTTEGVPLVSPIKVESPESEYDASTSDDHVPAANKMQSHLKSSKAGHQGHKMVNDPPLAANRKNWHWAPYLSFVASERSKVTARESTRALIAAVRKHRCIYDRSDPHHGSRAFLLEAWRHVLEELRDVSDGDVKKLKMRWTTLKRSYLMHKRAHDPLLCTPTDRQYMNWPWAPHLTFLDPVVTKAGVLVNVKDENEIHHKRMLRSKSENNDFIKQKVLESQTQTEVHGDSSLLVNIKDETEIEDEVKIEYEGKVKIKVENEMEIEYDDKSENVLKNYDDVNTVNIKNEDENKVNIKHEDENEVNIKNEIELKIKNEDEYEVTIKDEVEIEEEKFVSSTDIANGFSQFVFDS